MTRFTPLESDVLDALAWDLRDLAPDLAGQFAESLPGQRRNTGSGLFTELIVDRTRPPPITTPTGRFGTVHAMVGDLADPVAFQVDLREGRLLALHGDAYGQDTRDVDFATVRFDQVFTVNDQGESVAFDPAALMPPSPLLDLHSDPGQDIPIRAETRLHNTGPLQGLQDAPADAAGTPLLDMLFGRSGSVKRALEPESSTLSPSTGILAFAGIAFVVLIATLALRLPPGFIVIVAGYGLTQLFRRPALMRELGRMLARAARAR